MGKIVNIALFQRLGLPVMEFVTLDFAVEWPGEVHHPLSQNFLASELRRQR